MSCRTLGQPLYPQTSVFSLVNSVHGLDSNPSNTYYWASAACETLTECSGHAVVMELNLKVLRGNWENQTLRKPHKSKGISSLAWLLEWASQGTDLGRALRWHFLAVWYWASWWNSWWSSSLDSTLPLLGALVPSIPGQGTETLQDAWCSQKKMKTNKQQQQNAALNNLIVKSLIHLSLFTVNS